MGMILDMREVQTEAYIEMLTACARIVDVLCEPVTQVVKVHPRAQQHVDVWDAAIQFVPKYIPAEFVHVPNLKVVIFISSTAISSFGQLSDPVIISLVELVPFMDSAVYQRHKMIVRQLKGEREIYCPTSFEQLDGILRNTL